MSQPTKKKRTFIDPLTIGASILKFALEAKKARVATIEIVLQPDRLGWRDHGKPHGYRPPLATLETKTVLKGFNIYQAHETYTAIEAALKEHNANLEN